MAYNIMNCSRFSAMAIASSSSTVLFAVAFTADANVEFKMDASVDVSTVVSFSVLTLKFSGKFVTVAKSMEVVVTFSLVTVELAYVVFANVAFGAVRSITDALFATLSSQLAHCERK